MKTTEPNIKILIARSIGGVCVVLTTNSSWVASDCENISCSCDDIGIDEPQATIDGSFFLWEGSGRLLSNSTPDGCYEPPEPDYTGTIRPVTLMELPELLDMAPPPEPEIVDELTTETMMCILRSTTSREDVDSFIKSFSRYGTELLEFIAPTNHLTPRCCIRVPSHCANEFLIHALNADIIVGISNETSPQ